MKKISGIILLLCLSVFINKSFAKPLTANVAKVSLTPPLEMKYSLGGYGDRMSKPATGVHDTIWTKAVVLNNGDKKYAVVTMDLLGLPPNVKPAVIEKLTDSSWSEENIMLLPSHSHASLDMTALNDKNNLNSPQIGIFQPELLEFVVDKIAKSIKEGDKDLKPVKVGTRKATVDNMNRNRRKDPDIDRDLTVTRIDLKNGKPLAVLVNWTAHPTFMDENDMWVSAGWPGYLQRELESWIGRGVTVMYYNGAQGDQSATPPNSSVNTHYKKAELYGREMAFAAFDVYNIIKTKSNTLLDYNYTTVNLPERKAHPSFMETGGAEYGMSEEVVKVIMEMICPAKTNIGVVKIGDLVIAGAPGELAAGLGIKVKDDLKEAGAKYPVVGGLANEWISYILSADQYNGDGGYEASVSFYGENLGEVIVKGMIKTATPIIKK
jgi:hypothetical protein